mgnify:FL=1
MKKINAELDKKGRYVFPVFGQRNFISKVFLVILAINLDYITEENKKIISVKLNNYKILKSNYNHEKPIQDIFKGLD